MRAREIVSCAKMFALKPGTGSEASVASGKAGIYTANIPRGIYGITSRMYFGRSNIESAKVLLESGVRTIQYRDKEAGLGTMIKEAKEIRQLCNRHGAKLIVNDSLEVAMAANADGIHIGQKDTPIFELKKRAGNWLTGKIIGISAHTAEQAAEAELQGATYIGAGSIFPNSTKGESEVIGTEGLGRIMKAVTIPVIAIGGIKKEHIVEMKERYKVYGVAVISGILDTPDPVETAKSYIRGWDDA